jgi:hypothetical protein|tara:strand:- start:1647 stop:1868 length:222 start_codon:yes stop_codon:yes gene_type:complete
MANLERDVMRSYAMACDVIKDTVINNIQSAAARGDFELTNDAFRKIDSLVRSSVDQAARNAARQLQSAVKTNS